MTPADEPSLPDVTDVLDAVPDRVLIVGPDGTLVHVNEAFRRTCPGEVELGRTRLHDLVADPDPDVDALLVRWFGSSTSRPGRLRLHRDEAAARFDGARVPSSQLALLRCEVTDTSRRPFAAVAAGVERRNLLALQERLQEALDELAQTNRLLESSNAELEDYASVVSHDLRSPVLTIRAFAADIERTHTESLGPEVAESVAIIRRNAERSLAMLEAVLRLARLEVSGPTAQPVATDDAVRAAVEQLGSAIADAGANVEVGDLPETHVDPAHLTQLFQNLLANAIRFRHPDRTPRVVVSAERRNGQAHFAVADNGVGVDPDDRERVFRAFVRGRQARGDDTGAGMGLATCRKIVERYGGTIALDSEVDEGTTVRFTLPVRSNGR